MKDFNPRALLTNAAARAVQYLENLDSRRAFPKPEDVARLADALDGPMADAPAAPEDILDFLDSFGSPATVASAGGRYFGFVTGGALPAALAANWLAAAWDQNGFGHASSPAIALFEETALSWLKDCLGLPATAEGALVTGATMANFTCLAAARRAVLLEAGWDAESDGLFGAPEITVITGAEVHATILKVLAMLGLGRNRIVQVPVDGQGCMKASALPKIEGPTILCLQAGNVNTGAFDPAADIIPAAKAAGAWIHVDGAFGLWAKAAKEYAHLARGVETADSWATDAHKWLNVPYDCGAAFVRAPEALRGAMSIKGAYLLQGAARDAIDVTPDSSRRARAVDVWAALKSLGKSGVDNMVSRNCRQAKWLADKLSAAGVTILNDVVLNQILAAFGDSTNTDRIIASIQKDGTCWCGGTTWQGHTAMRISISSWATTDQDMEMTLAAILAAIDGTKYGLIR